MAISSILSSTGSELTVNLTWSNSRCVVVYYVEVTAAINTTSITNTTSQYIVLPLQIGVVYSFRVRGADSINRLGEWSDYFVYTPSKYLFSGGAIAGIAVGGIVILVVGIMILAIIVYCFWRMKPIVSV